MIKQFLILILITLVVSSFATAMGFGETEKAFHIFEPGFTKTYTYYLIPTVSIPMNYTLEQKGPLAEYIHVEPANMKFYDIKLGERPVITARVDFPASMNPNSIEPGLYDSLIYMEEETGIGEGNFKLKTGANIHLKTLVLFDGKYLSEPKLEVESVNEYKPINAKLYFFNYGRERINSVYAKIDVYNQNDELKLSFQTNSISADYTEEEKEVKGQSNEGLASGTYKVKATVYADEEIKETDYVKLKVGNMRVDVNSYTNKLEKNNINLFEIEVQSFWNDPLDDVYGIVTINGKDVKTPTTGLNPWGRTTISAYIDTREMQEEEQDLTIKLYQDGTLITTKEGTINLVDKIEGENTPSNTAGFSITDEKKSTLDPMTLMIIFGAIIIVLAIFNVVLMMRKKKK